MSQASVSTTFHNHQSPLSHYHHQSPPAIAATTTNNQQPTTTWCFFFFKQKFQPVSSSTSLFFQPLPGEKKIDGRLSPELLERWTFVGYPRSSYPTTWKSKQVIPILYESDYIRQQIHLVKLKRKKGERWSPKKWCLDLEICMPY